MASLLDLISPNLTQWRDKNQNALLGLGTSLLSDGMDFSGVQQGAAMDQEKARLAKEEQRKSAEREALKGWIGQTRPELAPLLDAGIDGGALVSEALKPAGGGNSYDERYTAGQQYGLSGEDLNTFALTGSIPGTSRSNVTYGVTPIYGTDTTTGKTGMGVQGSDGSFKLVDTGNFQPLGPFDLNAQKAAGTAAGKGTTEAALSLPNVIAQAEQSLANLEGLLPGFDATGKPIGGTNRGFDEQFGTIGPIPQQWMGALDGSEKAGFQGRIRQVQGEAFLTAIQQLKGLGALSDAEGQTATKAITRISEKLPQGEFITAVRELQAIVALGVERAKAKAAQSPAAGMLGASSGDDIEGILSGMGL